jgi:hypothetical protein
VDSQSSPVGTGLGDVLTELTGPDVDVPHLLGLLVGDAAGVFGADSAAVLAPRDGALTLLAATSHRAADLEMLQVQRDAGPCVDSIARGEVVSVSGAADLAARWPEVGAAIVAAGFVAVECVPVVWRRRPIAGLNLFYRQPLGRDGTDPRAASGLRDAYAAVVALTILSDLPTPPDEVDARIAAVVGARVVVERAKGVIAERERVSMEVAYRRLLEIAVATSSTLTHVAEDVVRRRRAPDRD